MQVKRKICFFLLLVLCLTGCRDEEAVWRSPESLTGEDTTLSIEKETQTEKSLLVFVCGAVLREDVVELPEKSRVRDAILAAGGFLPEAAKSALNLAAFVSDGERIYVPTEKEVESGQWKEKALETEKTEKVNLNTASKEELMTLSGIGAARAEAILSYRKEHGPFQTIEEIMKVSGIGEGMFSRIKDRIVV